MKTTYSSTYFDVRSKGDLRIGHNAGQGESFPSLRLGGPNDIALAHLSPPPWGWTVSPPKTLAETAPHKTHQYISSSTLQELRFLIC